MYFEPRHLILGRLSSPSARLNRTARPHRGNNCACHSMRFSFHRRVPSPFHMSRVPVGRCESRRVLFSRYTLRESTGCRVFRDAPLGLPHSMESMRSLSPCYATSSSPGVGSSPAGNAFDASSSPWFESNVTLLDAQYEPRGSSFETSSWYDTSQFDAPNDSSTARFDSGLNYSSGSPQFHWVSSFSSTPMA
jgi:hypothetical protein